MKRFNYKAKQKETGKIVKVIAIAIIALILLVLNYNILKNPYGRKHSGLIENDMTIEEYLNKLSLRDCLCGNQIIREI